MTVDLLAATDPEAVAFFADVRAALTSQWVTPAPAIEVPAGWPVTEAHTGATLTVAELHARRGHALRISYDWIEGRHAMWVGHWPRLGWSILQGTIGGPASVLTSLPTWDSCAREMDRFLKPGRALPGSRLTVDEWVPEFTVVCLAHGDDCGEHDGGHNFVQRRTLPRYPDGARRPCGGGSYGVLGGGGHDGIYRYRFQVDGRWRLRFGCRSHHPGLLEQHLSEADGTVTVQHVDDHHTH